MPCFKRSIAGVFGSWLFCLGFFLTVLGMPIVAAAKEGSQDIKEITVAVAQDTAPFYFRDAKGVADGWLVDLWQLWSQKSGIKINFVLAPFGETLKLTKEGKVDVQGGCFYSEQRATYLDYVAPLIKADTHFFFHKDIYGIKTLKDLLGFRIGVIKGDFAVDYLRTNLPGAALAEYVNNGDLFKAVKKGEIRVFVIDTPVGLYFLKKIQLLSNFRYFSDKPLYTNAFQAAVKKGDTVLPPVIKSCFDKISPEEKVQIERRWIGSKIIKPKGVLTIACDRYYPPFTMLTPSGKAAGILVDLWRLWSSKNFRKIEFVFGDWEETLQMVKDGRADFHSGLYKTPKRETFLSFSVPIFDVQDSLAFKTSRKPMMLAELSGARVGVIAGSGEESQLREQYPEIVRIPYEGYPELLTGLQDGDVIAIYDVGITLQRAIEDMGLQGEIRVSRETTPIRNLFAAVLKEDGFRLKSINSGFDEITEKEIRDVEGRWVSNPDLRQYSGKARPMVLTFEEKEWLKKHPHIRLGVDPNFMPFEGVSAGGEYEGISSSYVFLMSEKLNVEMTPVKSLSWHGVMDAVKAGELDVLPCVAKSPKRAEFLQFTRPYLDFQTVAVTRKDAPFIAEMKSLKDAQVAVVKGYFVQEMLEQDFPEMKLVLVDDIEQGLKAVAEGQAAAYVDNSASIVYAISKLGLADLKVAASTGYSSSLRFGVRKDWPQLATILDKALNSIPEEEKRNIANRWINVRFAQRTDWAFLIKMGIAVAMVIGLILTIIIIWNRRMAREMVQRKRAEERFQTIAATTPGAIIQIRFDADGRPEYLYLSPKAEAFFGMPVEQVMRGKERLPWHPEDFERVKKEVQTDLLAEADMNHVGRIISKEGAVKWIRLNASPSRNAEGDLIYNGLILDITSRKLAELDHIRSERKIKAMSQAAEDALVMIDGQGKVLFWNPAAEKLFGYTEAEAMGMDFHQMAAPEVYHEKIYAGLKHFAENGEGPVLGTTTEINARNRKGDEFPVEVTLSSFQVDEEWFAVGTVRDITERKKAEEAIKDSEQRMADLIDFLPDPILAIDVEGKVQFWNRAMEKLTGVKKGNIVGKGDYEYALPFYGDRRPILVDLVKQWDEELGKKYLSVKKEGNCLVSESFHPHMGDGGTYLSGIAAILYDTSGKPVGAIESLRDFTDRKIAEDAMKESEKKLKTILETAAEGFQLVNASQEIVDQNPAMCHIMGREKDEVIGKTIFDFVDEENKKIFLEQIELRKQGITSAYEIALSRPDGSQVNCLYNVSPLYDENNERIGAFAMVTDISDRKQSEDRLRFTQTTVDKAALTIFWVDPETGMFIYANEAACSSLGYTREELMSMHVPQIDMEFNEEKFTGLMEVLQTHSHVETEGLHKTKDGRILNVMLSIVLTQLENRWVIAVFSKDETEKKQAEKAVKESEQRVQTILNAINTGVIIIDPENRTIVDVNPLAAQMIGLPGTEIIGHICHEFVCPKAVNDCPVLDSEQEIENAERVLLTAAGQEIPILKTVTRVKLSGKTHLLESFIDISELKKAEQELKERLEELEQFNRLVVGREIKMIGLKEEVNQLLEKLGREEKYEIVQ